MRYHKGDKILFNEKEFYIGQVALYKEIEYYFVFDCKTSKNYKILYEEDGKLHQIIKFENYKELLERFK